MKHALESSLVFCILLLFGELAHAGDGTTLFADATIIRSDGSVIETGDVLVHAGRILRVARDIDAPDAEAIDLAGRYLLPGFIDAHVHFGQSGLFDLRPDYLDLRELYPYAESLAYQRRHAERYLDAYREAGVTTVYDTGGMPWTVDLQWRTHAAEAAPRVFATGTLLTPAPPHAIAAFNAPFEKVMLSLSSEEAGRAFVEHNVAMGSTGVKVWGFAPNDAAMDARIRAVAGRVAESGTFMLAHATTLQEAKYAVRLGAKVLVHSVDDQLVDDEFIQLAKENNVVYIPTLHVYRAIHELQQAAIAGEFTDQAVLDSVDAHTRRRLLDLDQIESRARATLRATDAQMEASLAKAEALRTENLRKVVAGGIAVAVGTDAGNPGVFHGISYMDELRAMNAAGVTPRILVGLMTRGGAAALQKADELGDVRAGMRADFTILERNPLQDVENFSSVHAVVRDGRMTRIHN